MTKRMSRGTLIELASRSLCVCVPDLYSFQFCLLCWDQDREAAEWERRGAISLLEPLGGCEVKMWKDEGWKDTHS